MLLHQTFEISQEQVIEKLFIKLVDKKSAQSTCIKPVDNLQQTCYHQAKPEQAMRTHSDIGLMTAR